MRQTVAEGTGVSRRERRREVDEHLNGGRLIVLGDWIDKDTYLVLHDGHFRPMRWQNGHGVEFDPGTPS